MHRLIFDFPDENGCVRRRTFVEPQTVLRADRVEDVVPVLQGVEQATSQGAWAAGFVTYEAAPAFDPAMIVATPHRMPLAWFGIYPGCETGAAPGPGPGPQLLPFSSDTSPEQYRHALHAIHEALAAGESYQVNYTTRLRASVDDDFDPDAVYASLRAAQGGGYHADLDIGAYRILSASPELFFRRRGSRIATRPMKGTRPRGRFTAEDRALAAELATSPKERAENLMIVDLLRNDLGRVACTGSVEVPELFAVEHYRTVLQMTSTIAAELRAGCGLVDIFRALFPCGSVTGAPKIQTMRIIEALEQQPREIYCGALGFVAPGGDCTFSVPIRTLWVDVERRTAEYGVGSGITADSAIDAEAAEMAAKAVVLQTQWPHFALIETLRLEDGVLVRLERHLSRLSESCAYFGRPYPSAALRAALHALAVRHPAGSLRVRIELQADGQFDIDTTVLEPTPPMPPIAIAREPVDARDVFLFHKTTHRAVYERARNEHPDAFDVLLWNREGNITEFTRANVVVQLDGTLCTPPRTAGLLAGCLRAELLEAGAIVEREIDRRDVARAERIWFVNSLRGWIECQRPAGTPRAAISE